MGVIVSMGVILSLATLQAERKLALSAVEEDLAYIATTVKGKAAGGTSFTILIW
jgi:hypothetical protein